MGLGRVGGLLLFVHQGCANARHDKYSANLLPPPSLAREFAALSESTLGDLDLNIIQMRMKCPRLFKDHAGNVDSQRWSVTGAVCFLSTGWTKSPPSTSAALLKSTGRPLWVTLWVTLWETPCESPCVSYLQARDGK